MKIIFKKETDKTWITAHKIEEKSIDGCFSPNEIASYLKIDNKVAQNDVDHLEERGLCSRIDHDYQEIQTGDERWGLIKLSLTVGREYEVLAIYGDDYIILNDPETKPYGNDPVAFHKSLFQIVDSKKPDFWQVEDTADGEKCFFPPNWEGSFFEEYHDGIEIIRKQFWNDLKEYYPETWKKRYKLGKYRGNIGLIHET